MPSITQTGDVPFRDISDTFLLGGTLVSAATATSFELTNGTWSLRVVGRDLAFDGGGRMTAGIIEGYYLYAGDISAGDSRLIVTSNFVLLDAALFNAVFDLARAGRLRAASDLLLADWQQEYFSHTNFTGGYLRGYDGDDGLFGTGRVDFVFGGGGRDGIVLSAGDDAGYGGDGGDWIYGGTGDDLIYGGEGDDVVWADDFFPQAIGDDLIFGDAGNDGITAGRGEDSVYGGTGDDSVKGGSDADQLWGDTGNDSLEGEAGADLIDGGEGDDTLNGGGWADTLVGGAGNDVLTGALDADRLEGGEGDDSLSGGGGADTLIGAVGADVLAGGADADRLFGGHGDDRVIGGTGDDVVQGGGGNDTLRGDAGSDSITGGAGSDAFVFTADQPAPYLDRVLDHQAGIDRILLTGFGFASVAEALALASETAEGVLFTFAADRQILIEGADIDTIGADLILG